MTGEQRRGGRRALVAGLLVAAVVAAGLTAPVQARVKAGPVAIEALGWNAPRPLAPSVTRSTTTVGEVAGDLYFGDDPAPAVVLLPGATPAGRDDERAVRMARSLAAAGRSVFVPELALYGRSLDPTDLDRIARAALALPHHRLAEGPAAILGFSYGGSYGLLAAADPRLEGRLALVAAFGAYADLLGVLQAATTGVSVVGGQRYDWPADPQAEAIAAEYAPELAPPDDRDALREALDRERNPETLSDEARAVHALFTNEDPERTSDLMDELHPEAREVLRRFSPVDNAHRIEAPVVAMHDVNDPAVPYAELLRLERALPDARTVSVALFDHVDPEADGIVRAMPDLLRTWRFAGWVLAAQE